MFIDVTATDLTKAKMVLNILCTMFSQYAAQPFTTEPVEVVDALGNSTRASPLTSHCPRFQTSGSTRSISTALRLNASCTFHSVSSMWNV